MDSIRLKPIDETFCIDDIFQCNYVKDTTEGKKKATLVECLYLDTADMNLLANNVSYLVRYESNQFHQTIVINGDGENAFKGEYTVITKCVEPDILLFPDEVQTYLTRIITGKPLLIKFRVTFENKQVFIQTTPNTRFILSRNVGCFTAEDKKEYIYEIVMKVEEGSEDELLAAASAITSEIPLVPDTQDPSIFIRGLKMIGQGYTAMQIDEMKAKQKWREHLPNQLFLRMQLLLDNYVAAGENGFNPNLVHDFRVELRKMLALLSAAADCLPEEHLIHKQAMEELMDTTNRIRVLDIVVEHVETAATINPSMDLTLLVQLLHRKREEAATVFKKNYVQGAYTSGMLSLWGFLLKTATTDLPDSKKRQDYLTSIGRKVKKWLWTLSDLERKDFNDREKMHDVRIEVKKARYVLEMLGDVLSKKAYKYIPLLREIQESFGTLNDLEEDIQTLSELGRETDDAKTAFVCGVLFGEFSSQYMEYQHAAHKLWKKNTDKLEKLREILETAE